MAESTVLEALTAELLGDVGKLHDDVKQLATALPDAAGAIRQAGQDSAGTIQAAVDKAVGDLSKSAVEMEVAKLLAAFIGVAETVLRGVRKEASTAAPSGWKIKVVVSLCLVVALSGVAGVIVGAAYVKFLHSDEEKRQIAAGKDFLQILPQLDPPTREKLVRLIEKNR